MLMKSTSLSNRTDSIAIIWAQYYEIYYSYFLTRYYYHFPFMFLEQPSQELNIILQLRGNQWSEFYLHMFYEKSCSGLNTGFNADAPMACECYWYCKLWRRWWEIESNKAGFHKNAAWPHAGPSAARFHDQEVATQRGFGHRYRPQPLLLCTRTAL